MSTDVDRDTVDPQLRATVDAAAEGWVLGEPVLVDGEPADFRVVHLNPAAERLLRLPLDQLRGGLFTRLWPNVGPTGMLAGYLATMRTGAPYLRTRYAEAEPGRAVFMRIYAERLGALLGVRFVTFSESPVGVTGAGLDVQLRAALDAAFDGFALLTAVRDARGQLVDFEITYANATGARLGGSSLTDTVGGRLSQVWPVLSTPDLMARYARVAGSGDTYVTEQDGPGSGHVWEVKATRVAADVVALSFRDVTARVRQQRRVLASERQARAAAARVAAVQAVTAELAGAVAVADVFRVMEEKVLAALGADGLMVMLMSGDSLVLRHNTGHRPMNRGGPVAFAVDGPAAVARVVRQRRPRFYGSREEFLAEFPGHRQAVEESDKYAWSMLPLISSGRVIGAMNVSYRQEHEFEGAEREVQVALGELCAQALERTLLFEAQKSIAADLQRALLPATLPVLRGARHAARYLPWTAGADVGGDWYDVIELDEDSVAVVIGDVAGHSTSAAATMGQIRSALRAYALEGHSPTGVMERVNRLVTRLDPEALATCCYLEVHLAEGTTTAVLAGHPPPIVRTGGQARPLQLRVGVPLGTDPLTRYTDTTLPLPPGSSLLLYTDGLVEDRRYPIDQGMANLCRLVARAPADDPDALADRVLSADAWPHQRTDDIALLALVTDERPATPAVVSRRFAGEASSAPAARRFATDILTVWGLAAELATARLLLDEIVTNAVQHTVGDIRVRLAHQDGRLRIEVTDRGDRSPQLKGLDSDAENGRGLFIVASLADRWGHDPVRTGGKTVWFELAAAG